MKQTDFAICLNRFLTDYLVNKKGCSPQTIDSYRYAFIFLLEYYDETLHITPDQLRIADLTYERLLGFLEWLEFERGSSVRTRNQRQAALNSFIRFLMFEKPEFLHEYQRMLGIPVKKAVQAEISYLKAEGVSLLMDQVNLSRTSGLRDFVILMLLYTTGIRVSELITIQVKDLSLSTPYTLLVHGKGNKSRYVPLLKDFMPILQDYLRHMGYTTPEKLSEWLFVNHMGRQFTRQGVSYITKKYGNMAHAAAPDLVPKDLSPHQLRHTTAMELVASGVDLIYIRDLLGHASVTTTEVYARTDAKLKREAIEAASRELVQPEEAQWDHDEDLKAWLKSFNRR